MTKNPIKIDKEMLALKALSIMNENKITSLCVTEYRKKNKTIGVIHIHNILENGIQ
jgi:arabinose-5-phosphate isomerase